MARNEFALIVFVTAWAGGLGCIEEAYDPLHAGVRDRVLPETSNWILTPTTPEDWAGRPLREPSTSPLRY